jgi:hypothetical protein
VRVDGDLNGHVAPGDSRFTLPMLRTHARGRNQNERDNGDHLLWVSPVPVSDGALLKALARSLPKIFDI